MKIGIISYCDHLRTYAHCNHQVYADHNGYTYIFDIAPTRRTQYSTELDYFAKISKLLKFLDLFDWIFWIDDDAFFTNFDNRLEDILAAHAGADLIFCKSPLNEEGGWTYISSGNFFLRNTPAVRRFLQDLLVVDMTRVKQWWDSTKYGIFTNGDQDAFVYLLCGPRKSKASHHVILDYEPFNTRPWHFKEHLDEHLLVHFTGGAKREQAQAFGRRFGLDEDIVPGELRCKFLGDRSAEQEKTL